MTRHRYQLQGAANKVDRTALKVHTPMRSTALMARSRAVPVDSWRLADMAVMVLVKVQ